MKVKHFVMSFVAATCMMACGSELKETATDEDLSYITLEGDSTIYGLACDGCNDTIVVFLRTPYEGSDPDTLNVLKASKQHHIFGKPRIGDKLAIVRNARDTTVADIVIVTEKMLGNWCYKVLPTLKVRADMDGKTLTQKIKQLPDSIADMLKVEREYGLQIKSDNVAFPIGFQGRQATSDEESPVVYPNLKFYNEWFIYNGKIVLRNARPDSLGQQQIVFSDTARLVLLEPDSLVLQFDDHQQSFYRKSDDK